MDALPWVLVAVLAGETVGAAGTLAPRLRAPAAALAAALGLLLAALASGLEPRLLTPAHWSELGAGIARGLEALSGVTLPYAGVDPWPDITLRLGGALLVTLAAVLAAWPREEGRGFPFFALAALLVLVATPVTAIGTPRSLVLGVAIAALTVCFLWLERLPLRPGVGVAVLAGVALAGALPLSAAADREGPWFDYSTLGRGARHAAVGALRLGALLWRDRTGGGRGARCCASAPSRPQYWKLENLEDFDGERWVGRSVPDQFGPEPEADLDENWTAHPQWNGEARVTVRGLRGDPFAGAGTTLAVDAGARRGDRRRSRPAPGRPTRSSRRATPTACLLRAAAEPARARRRLERLTRPAGRRADADAAAARARAARPRRAQPARHRGQARDAPFSVDRPPLALNERRGTIEAGIPALRNSSYLRTWRLAQRLKRGARNPYEFARRIDIYLERGFRYDERPVPVAGGRAAARALPVRGQGGLLPALLGRDDAAAAHGRRAGARGDRLLARRLPPPPGRVGGARPRRALMGRGLVRRHRLGHVRPDAERDARALADRLDQRADRAAPATRGLAPRRPARHAATRPARAGSSTSPARAAPRRTSAATAGPRRGSTRPAGSRCWS